MSYQKIKKNFKSSWYLRIPVFAGIFTVILMINTLNQGLFLLLNSILYSPIESIWLNISVLGDAEVIAVMLLPLMNRHLIIVWAALISGIITITIVELAKQYFALPRPPVVLDFDQFYQIGEYFAVDSFPSAHAAAVFSITAVIILSVKQVWIKMAIVFYACLVCLSQIAIGSNWPIDIFSGVLVGWLPASFAIQAAKQKILKTKKAKKLLLVLFFTIIIYYIYNTIIGDIEVVALKTLLLILCLLMAFPEIQKNMFNKSYKKTGIGKIVK